MIRPRVFIPLLVVGVALLGQPVYAHGFGERYDLPVPLGYYIVGAGLAVAVSFVVLGFFVRGGVGPSDYPRYDLLKHRSARAILTSPLLIVPIKLASVFLLGLLIFAGFFGDSDPTDNLAPTFIWIIWWVGMGFFVALVGNLWALVNPWAAIYEGAEWVYRRFSPEGRLSLNESYPEGWRMWPAAVIFFCFAWVGECVLGKRPARPHIPDGSGLLPAHIGGHGLFRKAHLAQELRGILCGLWLPLPLFPPSRCVQLPPMFAPIAMIPAWTRMAGALTATSVSKHLPRSRGRTRLSRGKRDLLLPSRTSLRGSSTSGPML